MISISAIEVTEVSVPVVTSDIFRAYDIRGIVDENLTPDIAHTIGLALGTRAHAQQIENFIVARDGRLSSPALSAALIKGLTKAGMHVIDIGAGSFRGFIFTACYYLNIGAGVMVTGSHNPKNYNGFKILLDFMSLSEPALQQIYQITKTQQFHYGEGQAIMKLLVFL